MAMEQLGMEIAKLGFQTADISRTGNRTGSVSDDFRNLLSSKQEGTKESQKSQEDGKVSEDTKPEKEDIVSDDSKKDAVSDDQAKTEKPKEEDGKAEELLAAYQMGQNLRPEITLLVPQTEEAAVPETAQKELQMGIQTEGQTVTEIPAEVQAQAVQVLAGKDGVQQKDKTISLSEEHQEADVTAEDAAAILPEAAKPVTHAEASDKEQQLSDLTPQFKRTVKSEPVKEEPQAQTEDFAAAQTAASVSAQTPKAVQAEEKEVVNEYVSTVHVDQPEELPEKVTDQLLAKLVEGVKEFEIHIEPANLGKIAVKILYEGTQAHVLIICSEKHALNVLGENAREIGNVLSRNFGGETTIIVDKQEPDYLNQTRDENEQARQEEQQKQKENSKDQDGEDAEQFLQRLRLGLAS